MSTDVSEVRAAYIRAMITLMMEAARPDDGGSTPETSVDIQLRTRQYIPEDSELHTRRHENFKSQTHKPSQQKAWTSETEFYKDSKNRIYFDLKLSPRLNAIKSPRVTSRVKMEIQSNVSEVLTASIIRE
jgi:hypothetical protein